MKYKKGYGAAIFIFVVLFLVVFVGKGFFNSDNKVGIQLVESKEIDGITLEFYKNYNRTCAYEGYHTFVVVSRDATSSSPLWVRLHGGAAGYFTSDGSYAPEYLFPKFVSEEEPEFLIEPIKENGLMKLVREHPGNFRFLLPSMCDHDTYSGIGDIDMNNPYNPDENGNVRIVDGLLALEEALEFTKEEFPTTQVFLHGTSSGSVGAVTLVTHYALQGKHFAGAILDSGSTGPYFPAILAEGCATLQGVDGEKLFSRVGYYFQEENMPHSIIEKGVVNTPLFKIWNQGDMQLCGMQTLNLSVNGITISGEGTTLGHSHIDTAVTTYNPGGASVVKKVCVTDPATYKACGLHSPTKYNAKEYGGDALEGGADYNEEIMQWIETLVNQA